MAKQGLEQEAAKSGEVYDCKITSSYGRVTLTKGIYLGKKMGSKKQLHGLVYLNDENDKFVTLIKFSKIKFSKNKLEIENPIRVYMITEAEEKRLRSLLEEKLKK